MIDWFVDTLRGYPEIAIFMSLALGYYFGAFTYKGLGLGAVTATLIAAVIIGQLDIKITGPLKPFAFLLFLFAAACRRRDQRAARQQDHRTVEAICISDVPVRDRLRGRSPICPRHREG